MEPIIIIIISEFLSFLKETIKIIPKNGKLTAFLSLLLPSIIFLSFSHLLCGHQYLPPVIYDDPSPILSIIPLLATALLTVLAEIALLLVYLAISHVSVIAAILVVATSASCTTGNSLSSSSKDNLFTSMKKTSWRKTFSAISHVPRTNCLLYFLYPAYFIFLLYLDNPTISNLIFAWVVIFDFQVYSSSDVWALALVVLVLEEEEEEEEEISSFCSAAMEKLGDVIEGHQLKGSMLHLFNTLLFIIVCILVWVFMYRNPTLYGLIFINALSIMKMVLFMAYAVLYFQCKKHPAAAAGEDKC